MGLRWLLVFTLIAVPASAQESQIHAEFRREMERITEHCGQANAKALLSCATTLITDKPVHVAVGSIAPQNGFGLGAAFTTQKNVGENWRLGWSGDAVGALGGAWRTGAYMKMVRTAVPPVVVVTDEAGLSASGSGGIRPYPVINLYAQAISLPKLSYYGLGSDSDRNARSVFGMRQSIVGANAIVPLTRWAAARALNLSVIGELNGRFVAIRGGPGNDSPSIEHLYTATTAPGLAAQPAFVQLGEGVRINPSLLGGHVRFNYVAQLQQFIAPSSAVDSFRRWTLDLGHEFPLYGTSTPTARDANGPNECSVDPSTDACPPISRNRSGTFGVRVMASKSRASGDSAVPFYFQRTLGGSDIDGQRALSSYDDYRFRGPHVVLLQETFEHSLFGPVGLWLAAEQGQVALQDQRLGLADRRTSYGVGVTIRAGGIPAVVVSWATGGSEGSHFAFTMSTSLLGGSARPSLR